MKLVKILLARSHGYDSDSTTIYVEVPKDIEQAELEKIAQEKSIQYSWYGGKHWYSIEESVPL